MNKKVGDITIWELVNLKKVLEKATLKTGLELLREFRDEKDMNDQEALAVSRMAMVFKYDKPSKVGKGE